MNATKINGLYNRKLSYRRETARQLPPPPFLHTPMRKVESETRNKRKYVKRAVH